jgi:mRNA-degrading endonuclease toxin of MazEF toxin-antitoxin module
MQRKLRPAVVIQSDRYNRGRAAVILAAITTTHTQSHLGCKVAVAQDSEEGRTAGKKIE